MFYRTLLGGSKDGASCIKTAPHKQRKGLLGMDSKENKPRRSTAGKTRSPPLSHLCGPVCGFCREGKVTALRSHTNPCLGRFAERLGGQNFSEPVWVSQARETKILYTNQPNLKSSTACPKELFYLKTRVTHGVENEAG